jgi:hypothetical protein
VPVADIAAAVTSLESQRAALALLAERMRVIRRLVPRPKSAHWAGVANALYEYRLDELESMAGRALAELDGARDETDRALATLRSRV